MTADFIIKHYPLWTPVITSHTNEAWTICKIMWSIWEVTAFFQLSILFSASDIITSYLPQERLVIPLLPRSLCMIGDGVHHDPKAVLICLNITSYCHHYAELFVCIALWNVWRVYFVECTSRTKYMMSLSWMEYRGLLQRVLVEEKLARLFIQNCMFV